MQPILVGKQSLIIFTKYITFSKPLVLNGILINFDRSPIIVVIYNRIKAKAKRLKPQNNGKCN